MIRSASSLTGYKLCATDGEMGRVEQFYFDYDTWTVRYLLMRSGKWLLGRQVLISPIAIREIDDGHDLILLDMKRFRVGNSPSVNSNRPLSRRYETEYHRYYGWSLYWGGKGRWADEQYPSDLFTVAPLERAPGDREGRQDQTVLGRTDELGGYRVFVEDRNVGTVEDFLIDDRTWALRYIIVKAAQPQPPRLLPVSPHWMAQLSGEERLITLDVPSRALESAPPYTKPSEVTRGYELTLFRHYGYDREIDAIAVRNRVIA